jgi:hypothetical protein
LDSTGQATQAVSAVAPVAAEYLPAGQRVQTEAPANEYVPAAQSVQAVASEFGEYFPAEQGVQSPTGPAFPAVQY